MTYPEKLLFHEDDYRQIELLSFEYVFSANRGLSEISTLSKFSQNGFVEIQARRDDKYPLKSKNISKGDFYLILKEESNILFREIFKGYSSHEEKIINCEGFAYENYIILYEWDSDNLILSCWMIYQRLSETLNIYPKHLGNALEKISIKWNLFLVDWNELVICNLAEPDSIENYISSFLV